MTKPDYKRERLNHQGVLNRHPERVRAPLFQSGDFFDARDLVQTKYEMLRHFRVADNAFTYIGTVAQLSIGADAPRDLLDNVEDATWNSDGSALAVIHSTGGKSRLEYPIGKTLYETAGWMSDIRFSAKGDRIAFLDHPLLGDDGGTVSVIDLSGKKTDLTERWASALGLAWSPSGDEIWFTATAT